MRGSADLVAIWTHVLNTFDGYQGPMGRACAIGSTCRDPDNSVIWLRTYVKGYEDDALMMKRIVSY